MNFAALKDGLETLKSDRDVQIGFWTGKHEGGLTFTEAVCAVFDDSGLDASRELETATELFGQPLTELLCSLGVLIDQIDSKTPPAKIANLPIMDEIRELSASAYNLVIEREKAGAIPNPS